MRKLYLRYCAVLCGIIIACGSISCDSDQLTSGEVLDTENIRTANKEITFDMSQECVKTSTILYAGQHTPVGEVTVTEDGDNYIINVSTDDGYCMSEIHIDVEAVPEDFPINGGGNPQIGHFEINEDYDCTTGEEFVVAMSEGTFIAVHAVVTCEETTAEDITEALPAMVSVCATAKGADAANSYFDVTIDGESWLAGDYGAWCADVDRSLDAGHCFDADVYASYEDLPDGIIENPGNIDLVNWIMNQGFLGQASPSGGTYTFGDIQWAIWELLDDANCSACAFLGDDWSEEKGQEIVDAAMQNGADFMPGCGDYIAVLLVPTDNSQPIFIPIHIPCKECGSETAWGDGCDFPGNNWAMYFEYGADD
ncbi:hypothetical protein SAMN04487906_1343 [Zhouia amylolytica]|uniref:Uncharacterized protein n=1 Tax=Zhouia amylolytica TaxID=376730 RepID=A0A1I6RUL8_9FLAO|nr:hypothetical protein [Zhouia amylolytica]SFS68290.1 hypothetical protein SAMN04487906_1343 [Zhouia amylolytica]